MTCQQRRRPRVVARRPTAAWWPDRRRRPTTRIPHAAPVLDRPAVERAQLRGDVRQLALAAAAPQRAQGRDARDRGRRALERRGLDRARLVAELAQAPLSARLRSATVPRSPGRGSSARSIASHSAGGRSRRWRRQRRQRRAELARGRDGAAAADGVDAAERLVQHERGRVEVGRRAGLLALGLLGRHVGERADDVAGARERVAARPHDPRDAEVGQLGGGRARRAARRGRARSTGLTSRCTTPLRVRVRQRRRTARSRSPPRRGRTARPRAAARASVPPRTSSETR